MDSFEDQCRKGLESQIEQLRVRWPQAHCEPLASGYSDDGRHLIIIPGVLLPDGWTHNICTVLFKIRTWKDKLGEPFSGFFVDLPDLRLLPNNAVPQHTRTDAATWGEIEDYLGGKYRGYQDADEFHAAGEKVFANPGRHWIAGHPQWRGLTRFWWRVQCWNPNYDTLYTAAMVIRMRLNPAR